MPLLCRLITPHLFLLSVLAAAPEDAISDQRDVLRFEHINGEQGLSHNSITYITQDRLGFMWFGTANGLNRFDGYRCTVFKPDKEDPNSLPGILIHGILEDQKGNLWIGTRDGGLGLLTPEGRKKNEFISFKPNQHNPNAISSLLVQCLKMDRSGRLWVGSKGGLDLILDNGERFVNYQFFNEDQTDLTITSMVDLGEDKLAVSTYEGLYILNLNNFADINPEDCRDRATRMVHDPSDPNSLGGNIINGLFVDRQNRLWVASRGKGLSLWTNNGFKHYRHDPKDPSSLSGNNASVQFQDKQGRLWLGTDGRGLNIFDPETGVFQNYRHLPRQADSLSNDNVNRVFQSREGQDGVIWIGTWGGGVNKLINQYKPFKIVQHDPENDNSLSSNFVFSIKEDRFGDLWVGTVGNGLNRLNRTTGIWERYVPEPGNPSSIGDSSICRIEEDSRGNLWIATEFGGLNQVIRRKHEDPVAFIRQEHNPNNPKSLASNNIKAFLEDKAGNFWVGYATQGLGKQTPQQRVAGEWTHIDLKVPAMNRITPTVQCLYLDSQNQLWVGSRDMGLIKWRPEASDNGGFERNWLHDPQNPNSLGANDVRTILELTDGRLLVGTFGGGVCIPKDKGDFTRYTERDGLANNFVYSLIEDVRGDFWVSTNKGLSRCNPQDMTFTSYGVEQGLQSDEFNTGAVAAGNDGQLYFGGVNGFNYFHPITLWNEWDKRSEWLAPVVLTGFSKMGQKEPLETSLENGVLRLDSYDKFFGFEMAVLDYHNPEDNQFAYKLEGFDRDWVQNGVRNFASYTNLDPGPYTFRYKGANSYDVWNEGTPLQLVIAAPFWQTWWFRGIVVALFFLTAAAVIQIRKYYLAYRGVRFIGHFKIVSTLGSGGSGTVYLARDKVFKRTVALKVLNSSMEDTPDGVRRFLQEAEIGHRLNHPNIVEIYEAGNHGKTRYISMAWLKGKTLKEYLDAKGKLNQLEIFHLAGQVLEGLVAIHSQNIVHRDLKSGNVMVLENQEVKIMDFGLARVSALTTVENQEQMMGTLAYMSPEQTIGKAVDKRCDIYAFGVILYEMWFGKIPFSAQNQMEMIYAIHNETPEGLRGSATGQEPIISIISKCMEKNPQDRYSTVDALKTDFVSKLAAGINTQPKPEPEQSSRL